MRTIEVDLDVYGTIWSSRLPTESSENEVLRRLLHVQEPLSEVAPADSEARVPKSLRWTDLLVWTLEELGGQAPLSEIYAKSREGRRLLNSRPTREHDASARECLESHCSDSKKYREKKDLFWMPEGKGAGLWALRSHRHKLSN